MRDNIIYLMQLAGLIVTVCLVLGISVVIAIILFFPYSTVNQSSWEPVFRSYDENIKAVSKSHLLTALLDRYEKYIRPLISSTSEGKANISAARSKNYTDTSKLLQEMVNPHYSYVKMFPNGDNVFVFAVKAVNVFSEEFSSTKNYTAGAEKFPMIGKVVLFSIPDITLLNKNESLNLTNNEAMGLNTCWEAYVPGVPITVAFSNDYQSAAIAYRLIVPGGFRYRARYYPLIQCNPKFSETPESGYYEKYAELTQNSQTEYTPNYDDLHLEAYSYVSAIAVAYDKFAYSVLYDTHTFHFMEKGLRTGEWIERTDIPPVYRNENTYEFCHDLFMIERDGDNTLLITFTRKGKSLNRLHQDIDMYERAPSIIDNFPDSILRKVYHYRIDTQTALIFSLADLESAPSTGSLFAISKDKDLAFVVKNYDRTMLIQLPVGNKPILVPQTVTKKFSTQIIAALKDLSIVAAYPKDTNSIAFYINHKNINAGICFCLEYLHVGAKEMSLSQLPKSLQKKRIVDMVLLDCDEFVENNSSQQQDGYAQKENRNEVMLGLLFEGGDILKIFVSKEELFDLDDWPLSFIEFPSSSLVTMLVTSLLILIPLFLGLRISVNREGVGNIFAPQQQNNAPPQQPPNAQPAPQQNAPADNNDQLIYWHVLSIRVCSNQQTQLLQYTLTENATEQAQTKVQILRKVPYFS
eukprot:TRINITY_DN1324_c0_g1_i1.p1 TRINITY_DN1324_c0_g1~~TRINITY_DN1324_c0_g1_i1.p1  ORF type:complete len:693 (+),score=40.15 TRINITY_DN1324_c0_g1_i1:5307-7385(+)